MRLYLVRHAIAEDGEDDDARALTRKGRKRFDAVVELLAALSVRFDRVLHSPRLRAVQTAERLGPLLDGEFEVTPLLEKAPAEPLLSACAGDAVALVGHEPHLSTLLSWLVTGEKTAGRFAVKKGAVACLEGNLKPGQMTLAWLLPPRIARRSSGKGA